MKNTHWIVFVFACTLFSCGKENRWDIELPEKKIELKYTDISAEFYDTKIPLTKLRLKYPFFFDPSTPDSTWESQRRLELELNVYDSVNKKFSNFPYKEKIDSLFSYYHYYFPNYSLPNIYTYSSGLINAQDPVIFGNKEGLLFIALDGFLGQNSQFYKNERIYPYVSKNMNVENLPPKIVEAIGTEIIPFNPRQQSFINLVVDEGKKLILADALLPRTSDHLKIGYTKEEFQWAINNEGSIWNYFVEQNMVFDTDKSLRERFLQPGPFSKFLNEIEADSPGRIGAWIGWQICKKYMEENPDVSLEQFIQIDTHVIFKESKYKPKKGEGDYAPTKTSSNDEVEKYEN